MKLEISVKNFDELMRGITRVSKVANTPEAKRIYLRAAAVLVREAKRLAPYDPGRKKGTHLRDAIFLGPGDPQRPDVLAGVNRKKAPHAHLVEFGTVKWRGKPYWRPALAATKEQIQKIIAEGLLGLMEKAQ
jgi:HK97 gp10 family phage protein